MKFEVKMYQGGRTFIEEVYAPDPKSARETAQNLNPYCKVISVNFNFK